MKHEVSVQALYDNPDTNAYVDSKLAYPEGAYDTWVSVTGVDKLTDGSGYIIEFGSVGEIKVDNDFTVFVDNVIFTDEEKADQKYYSQTH